MAKRLSELCSKLNISDALRLNIWTCFEHSLVRYASLMVDHHLDEMLLFAVHYMAKVGSDLSASAPSSLCVGGHARTFFASVLFSSTLRIDRKI